VSIAIFLRIQSSGPVHLDISCCAVFCRTFTNAVFSFAFCSCFAVVPDGRVPRRLRLGKLCYSSGPSLDIPRPICVTAIDSKPQSYLFIPSYGICVTCCNLISPQPVTAMPLVLCRTLRVSRLTPRPSRGTARPRSSTPAGPRAARLPTCRWAAIEHFRLEI